LRYLIFLLSLSLASYIYLQKSNALDTKETITLKKSPLLDPYSQQRDSYNYLNNLRYKAGMSKFIYNKTLQKSALSHAKYLITNNIIGHYEEQSKPLFTGVLPKDRVIKAGYNTGLSIENVSSNSIGYKDSVNGLFAAIYHRFGFLDFQVDEIGVGVAQDLKHRSKTAYVYNMGIYEINDLCSGESYNGRGAYTYHICKDDNFRISKSKFDDGYNACYKRDKKIVVYPYDNQDDVPPAFYDEVPDPLPKHRVSGFPISLQFNPYYVDRVKLKSFELFLDDKKIEDVLIYDHISDINSIFKPNEFALFPLKRLEWGSEYSVRATYEIGGESFTKEWSFKTKKLPFNVITIDKQNSKVEISNTKPTILYFKPKNSTDILDDIKYSDKLDISFIDKNTIEITTKEESKKSFKLEFSGRVVEVFVGEKL
jgi:uncharacterized protein YkwD